METQENNLFVSPERIAQMEANFWDETNDPETEEWREDLSEEEAKLVAEWDERVEKGMLNLCQDILKAAEKNALNSEIEEQEEMEMEP